MFNSAASDLAALASSRATLVYDLIEAGSRTVEAIEQARKAREDLADLIRELGSDVIE